MQHVAMLPNPPIFPSTGVWANRPLATIPDRRNLAIQAARYGMYAPQVQTLPREALINQEYATQAQQNNFYYGALLPPWGDALPPTWDRGRGTSLGFYDPQFRFDPSVQQRSAWDAHEGTVLAAYQGQAPIRSIPTAPFFKPAQFSVLAGCKCQDQSSLASAPAPTSAAVVQPPQQSSLWGTLLLGAAVGAVAMKVYADHQNSKRNVFSGTTAQQVELPTP